MQPRGLPENKEFTICRPQKASVIKSFFSEQFLKKQNTSLAYGQKEASGNPAYWP